MKNKNIIFAFVLMMTIFMIGSVLSEIQFYQVMQDRGNGTIRNRLSLLYTKPSLFADDYVLGNSPFETYLKYSINVQSHNRESPDFNVSYCNQKIWVWKHLQSNMTLVFEKNYTSADSDINNAQYFFQLYDGDQAFAQQDCYFINTSFKVLQIPVDMQMVQPTSECKSCQFYLWSKLEADVSKAGIVGNNVVTISSYVQKLVLLNFEIVVVLFWIALILLLFIAVGFIFVGVYWTFLYMWRLSK
jgi:hypothetical protein